LKNDRIGKSGCKGKNTLDKKQGKRKAEIFKMIGCTFAGS